MVAHGCVFDSGSLRALGGLGESVGDGLVPVHVRAAGQDKFEIYYIQTALCCLLPQRARDPDLERRLPITHASGLQRAEHIGTIADSYTI
jgi:hypothetical protein